MPTAASPPEAEPTAPRVAVIGGGVAGLAAAFLLKDAGLSVTVLEGTPKLGGKLAVAEVAGVPVDIGAEALLARRPEGTGLIGAVGLAHGLVQPGTTSAGIWTRDRIRPLPRRQFMGVPADFGELAATGIISAAGIARAEEDLTLPPSPAGRDESVASRVGGRLGAEVVDRLVEPLLGGVYAGRTDDLSFQATLPALAQVAKNGGSLAQAAAQLLPPAPVAPNGAGPASPASASKPEAAGPGPASVFTTLAGGLGSLPQELAAKSGAHVRTNATVRALVRTESGWELTVGSAHAPEVVTADAVILALPARPASRLLSSVAGAADAAAALAGIEYASMAIVTLAYPDAAFGEPVAGSGFLVPAVEARAIKAVTFSSVKWPHLRQVAPGLQFVRCSVGRLGEEAVLQRADDDLAELAIADLQTAIGVHGRPADIRVSRWGGGLPQYSVGHLDRVRQIRAGVARLPGVAVCGAAYDGVGIPACIASSQLAVDQVIAYLQSSPAETGRRKESR